MTLTSLQVCEHFQICEQTLYNWIKAGHLPKRYWFKLKRVYRFIPEVITWRPGEK